MFHLIWQLFQMFKFDKFHDTAPLKELVHVTSYSSKLALEC